MRFLYRRKKSALIILFFLSSLGILYASGVKEDKIAQAKNLIENRQYNEAILVLAEVMQEEPDKFDVAQRMLDEVRKARNTYNTKYENLIDLYNQPEMDLAKAYEIFKELEDLDKSPNKATADSFQKAKDTAVFVFNNNKFKKIMDEAMGLLDSGDYWGAVTIYLTGLTLMEEEFNASGFGTLIIERANRLKRDIQTASEAFVASKKNWSRLSGNRESVFTDRDEGSVRLFMNEMLALLPGLSSLRKDTFSAVNDLQEQNVILTEQQQKEIFHLSFIYLLVMGRTESRAEGGKPEGILTCMDKPWAELANQVETSAAQVARELIDLGVIQYAQEAYDDAGDNLSRGGAYALYASRMTSLWGTRVYLTENYGIPEKDKNLIREKAEAVLLSASQGNAADTLLALAGDLETAASYESVIHGMGLTDDFEAIRNDILRIQASLESTILGWKAKTANLDELASAQWSVKSASATAVSVQEILRDRLAKTIITEERLVAKEAELEQVLVRRRFEEESAKADRAAQILNGTEKPVPAGEEGAIYLSKDPATGKLLLTETGTALRNIGTDNGVVLNRVLAEKPELRVGSYLSVRITEGISLKDQVNALSSRVSTLLKQANDQITLAERLKNEAQLRLQESEAALKAQNFDGARSKLQAAGERFDASLAVQDDTALRTERDAKIAELGQRIAFDENEVVVKEVRALITEGKRYYTAENYEAAERVLQQALSRWRVTNPSNDNAELDYWLNIVRVALYMRSGRVIAQTDPLYRDMSNLLNLARDDFLKGKNLVEKGQRSQALPFFVDAEKKILLIKIPFPVNQEASVLSLRILQYRDLENFANLFRQKYNEAIAKLDRDPQSAYIEMKDLEAINPNYPGMANAIYTAEVKLGIRVPPPDPTKKLRSDELYLRALDLVQRNIRAQFPVALEYLNEAIKLTPEEQKVINLLDRVTSEIGGRSTIVLTNAAQQQYRQAEDAFIAGNFYEALRIVNNLLKDQKNSQFPPLIELKRRIESKI